MINFPDAPTPGQVFASSGTSWAWDGTKWTAASGGSTAYAPLASPVFTGDARAVTPATADNDTSIATTAYVQAQGYATSAAMTTADNLRVLKAGDVMSGDLGIGVPGTPQARLHVKGAGQTTGSVNVGVAMPNAIMLSDTSSGAGNGGMVVFAAGDDAWRFAAIKGFATNGASNTQGDIYLSTRRAATDAALTPTAVFTGAGTTLNTSGAWSTISSAAIKQDIEPYTRGLDAVLELNPVQFRYIAGTPFSSEDAPSKVLFGLIAEDVKPVVPEIVGVSMTTMIRGKEAVEIDTLEPGNLIFALINAIKELAAEVAVLKAGVLAPPRRRQ